MYYIIILNNNFKINGVIDCVEANALYKTQDKVNRWVEYVKELYYGNDRKIFS